MADELDVLMERADDGQLRSALAAEVAKLRSARRVTPVSPLSHSRAAAVDIPPAKHHSLTRVAVDMDAHATQVVAALVTLLETNPELRERVSELVEPSAPVSPREGRIGRLIDTKGRVADLVEMLPARRLIPKERFRRLNDRWNRRMGRRAKSVTGFSLSFTGAFAILRAIRYLQSPSPRTDRRALFPWGEGITIKGAHIHHYVWGLLLIITQGVVVTALDAPYGELDMRYMFPFGAGLALVLDEADLLLDLPKEWHLSVRDRPVLDSAVLCAGLLLLAAASRPLWGREADQEAAAAQL